MDKSVFKCNRCGEVKHINDRYIIAFEDVCYKCFQREKDRLKCDRRGMVSANGAYTVVTKPTRQTICEKCSKEEDNAKLIKQPMYATELAELARKEPGKYGGKRYKTDGKIYSYANGRDSLMTSEILIRYGDLWDAERGTRVFMRGDATITEIEPKPKFVSFMEAVNSGKDIRTHPSYCDFMSPSDWLKELGRCRIQDPLCLINGKWEIEGDNK